MDTGKARQSVGKYTKVNELHFDDDGRQICGVQLPNKPRGVICKNKTSPTEPRCYRHGKRAVAGPDHYSFKHGRYSRIALPAKLADRYEQAMSDPEYLSLRPELAIIDGMLQERLETLSEGGSGDSWKQARKWYLELEAAITKGDLGEIRVNLLALRESINAGASEAAARAEVQQLIKDRKALAESITRAMVQMRQTVTVEQTLVVMSRIVDLIERNVSDRTERAQVLREIAHLAQIPEEIR